MIRISVVIPLYNKEKEISDTLKSVINQSYPADEIIVVDDGSTDNSADIVKGFSDNRIKLIQQKNSGESQARNTGIAAASNEYIALIDADDLWEEDFLLEIKALIERFPNAVFYSTGTYRIDEYGRKIKNKTPLSSDFFGIVNNFYKAFSFSNYGLVFSSSVCIRKSIFLRGYRFPVGEKRGADLYYWLVLSTLGDLAFSGRNLSIYKMNATNRSISPSTEGIIAYNIKWFYTTPSLKELQNYKGIKKFIRKNSLINAYYLALNKDIASLKKTIYFIKQYDFLLFLMLLPAFFMPRFFLRIIKHIRRKFR
ncbi:glycosyltransferase family 2 protein [Spirochaetia bacterium 38H-sp]|uniref:Glycosyltransferase family 2 protein n=1 Tax=Rarispira pelagica TaxID=3141764 RepID=A0ABU9U9X4_9SPIR